MEQRHPPPLDIFIVRNTMTSARSSVFSDFQKILTGIGMWDESRCNQRDMTYQLGICKFTFFGLDKQAGQEKARGPRSDVCFVNEINTLDFDIGKQLAQRNRVLFLCDFNPSVDKKHWVYSWLCTQVDLQGRPAAKRFITTFRDNKFVLGTPIEATLRSYEPTPENIKRGTADEIYWKIFGCGQRASIEGLIYPENKWRAIDEWPKDVDITAFGMDFGFTNDPTTLIQLGYGKGDKLGFVYLKELIYKRDLYPRDNPNEPNHGSIESELRRLNINKDIPIFADSENPTAIDEIRSLGYNIIKAAKPADSVRVGIDMCRKFSMRIVEPSDNLIKELSNYKWKVDKYGRGINEPCKGFDHLCIAEGQLCLTPRGNIPIQFLEAGNMVMTRGGWRRIAWVGLTHRDSSVIRMDASDQHSIVGTCDHPIFTRNRGFIALGDLKKGDSLWSIGGYNEAPKVNKVYGIAHKSNVYDLSVDDDEYHEFVVNGILVKNCDAFRYVVFMTNDKSGFHVGGGKFLCATTPFKHSNRDLDSLPSLGGVTWDERNYGDPSDEDWQPKRGKLGFGDFL